MVGANGQVKLADFGIAKLFGTAGYTAHGSIVGTAEYMAPERLRDDTYDGRSDVYSVGIMMYRMLCGRVPFQSDDPYVVAVMQLNNAPPPLRMFEPSIPEAVERVALVDAALRMAGLDNRTEKP